MLSLGLSNYKSAYNVVEIGLDLRYPGAPAIDPELQSVDLTSYIVPDPLFADYSHHYYQYCNSYRHYDCNSMLRVHFAVMNCCQLIIYIFIAHCLFFHERRTVPGSEPATSMKGFP